MGRPQILQVKTCTQQAHVRANHDAVRAVVKSETLSMRIEHWI